MLLKASLVRRLLLHTTPLVCLPASLHAGVNIAPLTGFGGNDGWLAPLENGYAYLTTGNTERGMAYHKNSDLIILVSRSSGNSVRMIDALSGEAVGELPNPGGYSGGTFALNMCGVGDDGAIYAANLQGNVGTNSFKVYRWASAAATEPVVFFNGNLSALSPALPVNSRIGDTFDVTGAGADTRLVTGFGATSPGYVVLTTRAGVAPEQEFIGDALSAVTAFTGANAPAAGDFRLGITFMASASEVWGRQTSGSGRRTTYAGAAGTALGAIPVVTGSQAAMDFALVGGVPLLAVLNMASSVVSLYDVTVPSAPSLVASRTNTSGTLTANGNGVGSIKWGKTTPGVPNTTATLYAMATNQGLQAFTVTVTPEITPAVISAPPVSRSVYERGVAAFSVSATGSPPLTYQWKKGGTNIAGATSATLTVRPVMTDSAGDYTCVVNNAFNTPAESAAATLTVVPSMNTTALTECWQLPVGSRPWLTEGDTQRGVGYNPVNGHVYVATRTPSVSVQVINAADGSDAGALNMTDVPTQTGTAQFPLNMLAVAGDGAIYACNLSNIATGGDFRIWQWPDDHAATVPAKIYEGTAAGMRTGDSFAARGAGPLTEFIAGTTGTGFVLFKNDGNGFYLPYFVNVSGATAEAFQLGIGFGAGNTVWGKDAGRNVVLASYDLDPVSGLPVGTGTLLATFAPPPTGGGAIAVDTVNSCLAHIHSADSDNVSLYRLPGLPLADPPPASLELLDQEFFQTDNVNANGTGQAVISGNKLFALNTNNGLACYTIAKPLPPALAPVIRDVTQSAGNVSFKLRGTVGKTYVIEKSTQLTPLPTWSADGTVTQNAVDETVTRLIPAGTPRLYFRAREQTPAP